MNRPHRDDTPSERELAALADRSLPSARWVRVERAASASPRLQANIAAQRRALNAVHGAAGELAPPALRARLAFARAPSRRQALPHARRAVAGAAVALAALAVNAVFTIDGGTTEAPSVADAAVLATRTPHAPLLAPRRDSVTLPRLSAAGPPYPYWEDRFGYEATGVRRDQLASRSATTVYYHRARRQIAYTIVWGAPIAAGASTHNAVRDGTLLRAFTARRRVIVTWLRQGHTCVLTSTDTPLTVLLRLASWKG
jgi:hypothetical protein